MLVATGTHRSTSLGVPGEDRLGVLGGTDFLRKVKLDQPIEVAGKRVIVVGGGNVAMDAARTARRLGAASVTIAYRRVARRDAGPPRGGGRTPRRRASPFRLLVAPAEVLGNAEGAVSGLRCVEMRLGAPGRVGPPVRRAHPGLRRDASRPTSSSPRSGCARTRPPSATASPTLKNGRLACDAATCQTAVPHVFAAGDAVHGPTDITRAVGEGRKAAHQVDAWLNGRAFDDWDTRLPVVDKQAVLARQKAYTLSGADAGRHGARCRRPTDFHEVEAPLTEAEARRAAGRCIDCAVCSECNECVSACPVDGCIDLRATDQEREVRVGAVVVSTGFKLFPADLKPEYGYGVYKNVITGMQMDRLLAPTRPFNTILRPGDGKVPERIAYILCTGSRDETVNNPLCSRFCCMYSIKQNQLLMGALPLADITVHYMDIRAPGKRYDEFYEQAKAMGATYVKGRVADVEETPAGDLVLTLRGHRERRRDHEGRVRPGGPRRGRPAQPRRRAAVRRRGAGHRRVAVGGRAGGGREPGPDQHPGRLRGRCRVGRQGHRGLHPPRGCRRGPGRGAPRADEAPAADRAGAGMSEQQVPVDARPIVPAPEGEPGGRRIGVYVCHCGGNISDYVDVEKVIDDIRDDGDVVVSRTAMFACSDATQQDIVADIQANELDGLVVASCSPKLHTYTFRGVAQRAGLNPYEYTQVNIREQCSWVHTDDHDGATAKATALVKAGIGRTRNTVPLEPLVVDTIPHTLVIGGGIAGLRAAVGLADIGLQVTLVERELELGGWVRRFGPMYPHDRKGRELIDRPGRRGPQAPHDHRPHRRRAGGQVRQLRQLRRQPPHRRRGRRDHRGRRRLHRRRDRASTSTGPRTASWATGSTAS